AFERSGAEAVMLARGSLGNPWRFARLLGQRHGEPPPDEVVAELEWLVERAREHLGEPRASRYLRKFYPWYAERLGLTGAEQQALVAAENAGGALRLIRELTAPTLAA